jgi:hypothetical protein
MASTRVSPDEVKEIITTEVGTSDIGVCIKGANLIVDTYLANQSLGAELLKEIERWLAAHLLAMSKDPRERNVRVGEAEVRYTGNFGKGLEATTFGQVVLSLDSTGKLSNLNRPKALFTVLSEAD